MTAERAPAAGIARLRRSRSLLTRLERAGETRILLLLGLVSVTLAMLLALWPTYLPVSVLTVPLVFGHLALGPKQLPWFVVITLAGLALAIPRQPIISTPLVLEILVTFGVGLIILLSSFRRTRLGVGGARGESMLVDLRDRINRQGLMPRLPEGWTIESALRSASGSPFAGDFIVAARPRNGNRFDVVMVDVSGKGDEAGTRSLLLSGAFGGLLGSVPPERFLSAANDFLVRQDWEEGFATAVHLSVDLSSGEVRVWTAGHPPAVQWAAGAGRWSVHDTEGPLLGLLDDAEFIGTRAIMRPGDVIMLYTDGMVETPRRDISVGIDALVAAAERDLRGNFEQGAERLIDSLGSRDDDRALLLLHRQ